MNGADTLVQTLLASGVRVCFANPGTSEMHFVAALDRHPEMRCILCLFEGGTSGAADGYFRMSRKVAATLLPLLILWLGIGIESKIAIVFLGAIFPIVMNVMAGMRTLDEHLLRCARSFGATDRQILLTIALPSTLPFLIAGIRLAVGRALIGVVVGELVASTAGIGHMMAMASASFQTDKVFVGVMILAATGYGLTELLSRAEAHFERWRPR